MNFGPGLTFEPGHFCMVKFGSDIAPGPPLHRTAVKLGLEPCQRQMPGHTAEKERPEYF